MRVGAAAAAIMIVTLFTGAGSFALADPRGAGRDQKRPPAKAPPASISGIVTTQSTGAPVARARVILSSPALPQTRVTLSDAQGQYEFSGIPAGDYDLLAVRSGYALVGGSALGAPVRVGGGERRTGVTLVLQAAGTIPGRLQDEDGSPLAGALVEALSLRLPEARKPLLAAASAYTDDRGEFRLSGLPAGQYFVIARDTAFGKAGDDSGALRYPPTYFPGVVVETEARPISVSAGADSPRAEFRIRIVKPAHVSGVLQAPDTRALVSGAVVLIPRDGMTLHRSASEDVEIRPDGRFVFRNVPPGSYQLRARAAADPSQVLLFGSFAVQVEADRDVPDLIVTMAAGAVVDGQVEWIGTGAKAAATRSRLRVRVPFADGTSFGDALTGDVASDGTFRLKGVMTGSHFFLIEGLPEPWALTRVRVRGREAVLQPIGLHEGEHLSGVRLIVTTAVTEVSGAVADAGGGPVADALILLTPPGAVQWSRGDPRFQMARSDRAGRYRVRSLPPGAYRIAALIAVDELAAWRPEWLARIDAHSRSFVVADAAAPQTLDLVAVSPQALPAAVSR
jgi:protocatechuate 3,4-dioxygenase beta subunit